MNGLQLYNHYTSKRDYSGSPQDEYAQTLETLLVHLQDDLFPLLERAEKEGKKLSINSEKYPADQYLKTDIILV